MSDKIVAGFVTAAVVAPLCSLCILGPTVFGSVIGGMFAWFGGFDPVAASGLAVIGAILAHAFFHRRRDRHGVADG